MLPLRHQPAGGAWALSSRAAHHPRGASRPAAAPQPPSPAARTNPGLGGKLPRYRRPIGPVPGLRGALPRLPAPGRCLGPHAGRRRPRARKFANFAPPPRRASAGRRNRCPARRRRRPCPGLSQAGRPPSGPARTGGGGGEPGTPAGAGGGGPEADGGRRGKFQDRGHQQRRSGLRGPESQRRAEGPPRAPLGTSAHAAPHQPPAQPVTRSVTRSRPRPPAGRAARATVSADQPWTAPRAAPRLPVPLPRRSPGSAASYPLSCAATDRRPRVAAAAPTPFLCCWTFGGGEGEPGKVGRRGPSDPVCDRGAGSDRRPWSCGRCGPGRPSLGPAASAALGLLLRRELAGAAHSSTGRCAAHSARAAAARPPDTPPRRPRAPADTPPSPPARVAAKRAPPLGPEARCGLLACLGARLGEPHLIRPGPPTSALGLLKGRNLLPVLLSFINK